MKQLKFFLCAGIFFSCFVFTSCDNDGNDNDDIDYSEFKIVNNSNGAVTSLVDDDYEPLEILQTIPSLSSSSLYSLKSSSARAGGELRAAADDALGSFPANLPIMFFFNDKIYLNSIKDNIEILVDEESVKGTITINEGFDGAILTFIPWKEFKVNKSISVTVKKGLQDKGGNEMLEDVNLLYQTVKGAEGAFDGNGGFEKGSNGVMFIGDGAIKKGTTGPLGPQEGEYYAAVSSGNSPLVSESGISIGYASSLMILGPVNKDIASIAFYYDFISAEFNDYVNSAFDDCAMITVTGPKGSYSEFITSVNTIAYDNVAFSGYPGMPDSGDSYAGHIGWTKRTLNFSNVGTPAYITFTVTDVSDLILSSILAIDNISY